jgi:protein-tyrosine phosphatase
MLRTLLGEQVPGSVNLRDFGGYPTLDGCFVRTGALYRSGNTHEMGANGVAELVRRLGLRSVVDLRSESERSRGLSDFDQFGVASQPAPLATGLAGDPTTPRFEWIRRMARGELDWADTFWRILHLNQERFVQIVAQVGQQEALPVLVHCTSGRDRTGLTVAIVQAALGVSIDDVASEYALSDTLHDTRTGPRSHLERLFVDAEIPAELVRDALSTRPETMRQLFARIEGEYGSPQRMLRGFGVSDQALWQLRRTLLVASTD